MKTALVRRPGARLAEGLVTHIRRRPVDIDLAYEQHERYRGALAESGWTVREVEPLSSAPDSVFVEDTVVVCEDLAIITRPGALERREEVAGTAEAARQLGLSVANISGSATLDGGDVLQVGKVVYVGRGGRTNDEGILQLSAFLSPYGRTVIPVGLSGVLHLKSAVTTLPDGECLALTEMFETDAFPNVTAVSEESGAHVVLLGGDRVLIAASAPKTAAWLADRGWEPVVVDISEFEKLEGCVTCLSVLVEQS